MRRHLRMICHRHSGRPHVPSSLGGRGYPPRPRLRLDWRQLGSRQPRRSEGDERDRELPHGSSRRACCALRERRVRGTRPSPTTAAATGTARSARARRHGNGWRRGRPSCCRCHTSTSCSRCRPQIGDIAYQNKAVIYDLLFKASAETMTDHRGRSEAPRRADRHHLGAAHVGLGDDAPSARAHDRAGRRHRSRWIRLDRQGPELPAARAGALATVPAAHARAADGGARRMAS